MSHAKFFSPMHDGRPVHLCTLADQNGMKVEVSDLGATLVSVLAPDREGKHGVAYAHRTALCLETENFPDAPNQKNFPGAVLRPGETYRHVVLYKFGAAAPR